MIFGKRMFDKVLRGEKTVTRRLLNNDVPRYKPGRDYAVQRHKGDREQARFLILSATALQVGLLDDPEAVLEGFDDREGFIEYWVDLWDEWDEEVWVWRYEFVLLQIRQLAWYGIDRGRS